MAAESNPLVTSPCSLSSKVLQVSEGGKVRDGADGGLLGVHTLSVFSHLTQ